MNLNDTFAAVQAAGRHLALLPDDRINQILNAVAEAALEQTSYILSENRKDLERMSPDNPKYDRLRLTEERLRGIASDTQRGHSPLSSGQDIEREHSSQWHETH